MRQKTKKRLVVGGVVGVALLILAVIAVAVMDGGFARFKTIVQTTPEAIEAVVSNAEQELRPQMRPMRGTERLLIFAIDGLGRDEMASLLKSGDAPVLSKFMGRPEGEVLFEWAYFPDDTLSILPSSTIAAWSTVFTGALPAETGVPGNEFFLRDSAHFHAVAPTGVPGRGDALKAVNDGLLNDILESRTLYERADLRAHVSMSQVYRGADVFTLSESALLDFIVSTTKNATATDEEIEQSKYEALDSESFDALQDAISEHGVPDIQTVYLPGLDLFSHASKEAPEKQSIYFREVIDPIIEKVFAEYVKAGVLDDTWVVVVSDHGHTPVMADDAHALSVEDFEPALGDAGYRLRPPFLAVDTEKFNAVLAAQGAMGYLYLADRSRCDADSVCDWSAPARWASDVLPALKAIEALNDSPTGLDGALELILTRNPEKPDAELEVWDGGQLHAVDDWLANHELENQLELSERLRDLAVGPFGHRVGEIVMISRFGTQYPKAERYYFSLPVESEHGSATPADSRFTFLVARRGVSGDRIRKTVTDITGETPHQKHVTPVALRLLGVSDSVASRPR